MHGILKYNVWQLNISFIVAFQHIIEAKGLWANKQQAEMFQLSLKWTVLQTFFYFAADVIHVQDWNKWLSKRSMSPLVISI